MRIGVDGVKRLLTFASGSKVWRLWNPFYEYSVANEVFLKEVL